MFGCISTELISKEMLNLDARLYQHPNYAEHFPAKLDKLLGVGFIHLVKSASWLRPIVIVLKTNGQIRVCVDYRKLNESTINDAFPLPFTDGVLDTIARHEMYTFLDGFNGYNQIRIVEEDKEKTAFLMEWGVFVAVVMMFGLKQP